MIDILIVEDNKELREVIERFLIHEGYQTRCTENGSDALQILRREDVRLLLVDIMLPDMDGFHICEEARKNGNLPIMIMSARTQTDDKILGYDLGADDYVEKPFPMSLLLAKVKALLRRGYEMKEEIRILKDRDLEIDLVKRRVTRDKEVLSLSIKEYELLVLLMKHAHTTLNKEYIFSIIWSDSCESELSTLTTHVNTLREKIEEDPRHPKRLLTVWGVGYRYEGME